MTNQQIFSGCHTGNTGADGSLTHTYLFYCKGIPCTNGDFKERYNLTENSICIGQCYSIPCTYLGRNPCPMNRYCDTISCHPIGFCVLRYFPPQVAHRVRCRVLRTCAISGHDVVCNTAGKNKTIYNYIRRRAERGAGSVSSIICYSPSACNG